MIYYAYEVKIYYIIQPKLIGTTIEEIKDESFENIKKVLAKLEKIIVYIPNSQDELKIAIQKKLNTKGIKKAPKGMLNASIQYLVNSQIYNYLKAQNDLKFWQIEMETEYSEDSKHRVDVVIREPNKAYNIWIESDNARLDQLYKKLWEKLPIILKHGNVDSDIYVPFIYTTKTEDLNVNKAFGKLINTINNNININNIKTSFAIAAIDEDTKKECINIDIDIDDDYTLKIINPL